MTTSSVKGTMPVYKLPQLRWWFPFIPLSFPLLLYLGEALFPFYQLYV